ncbi:unnamed protein product, partial [Ectocarpus sp. 12 AP-2014]
MGFIQEIEEIANNNLPQLQDKNGKLSVLKPIDSGAIELLRDINNSALSYNPLHIEPLLEEVNQHLSQCLELQSLAQGIERQAIMDIINYDSTTKELELRQQSLDNLKTYDGNTKNISKQVRLQYENGAISSDIDSINIVAEFENKRLLIEQEVLENKKSINEKINE